MIYLKTYAAMFLAFILIDGVWLGLVAPKMYQKAIGHLMAENVMWGAALVFYVLYLAGVLYFAVMPAEGVMQAAVRGALLGGLCYATYDLTNWATLRDWPAYIVGVDIIWGMLLTASIATVGAFVFRSLS